MPASSNPRGRSTPATRATTSSASAAAASSEPTRPRNLAAQSVLVKNHGEKKAKDADADGIVTGTVVTTEASEGETEVGHAMGAAAAGNHSGYEPARNESDPDL